MYKLAFGPRSFIVVSDPVMAKHVLKSSVGDYDKGVLASVSDSVTKVLSGVEHRRVHGRHKIMPGDH